MTPEELRSLADEATTRIGVGDLPAWRVADARLIVLAPDLARLCAELGEALVSVPGHGALPLPRAALAKLSELSP